MNKQKREDLVKTAELNDIEEECDWREDDAFDLVYNLNNPNIRGEIDKESGIMSF